MVRHGLALAGVLFCLMGGACAARGEEAHIAEVRKYIAAHIVPWLSEPVVLDTLHALNLEHSALTDVDIERLDQEWVRQLDAPVKPLIDSLLNNELSQFLREKMAESQGYISQIIVMDGMGVNVGQVQITEDYWQGDEDKWQKSFKAAPGAIFFDDIEKGRASKRLTMQVSLPITDPGSTKAIGAITVSIDVGHLSSSH